MMRFILLVRSNAANDAEAPPVDGLVEAMNAYNDELTRAGVMLDGVGFQSSSLGARVTHGGGKITVTRGPFDPDRLLAGYTMIQAASLDEAVEWARRMPNITGPNGNGEVEIRQIWE